MSLEAEKSVIGSLLVNDEAIASVSNILSPEMFTDSFLGRVYYEIKKGFENHEKIDLVILPSKVSDSIRSENDVERELGEIVSHIGFDSESVESYALVVLSDYRSRKAIEIVSKIEFSPNEIDKQIRDVIAGLESLCGNGKVDDATVPEIADKYKDEYFVSDERPRIKTGFTELDEAINLRGGDVLAIGARPKTGKSALAMQIAIYLESLGLRVGYFNLEMTKKQIFERIVAFESGIELNRIINATRYLTGEKEQYEEAIEKMKGMENLTIFSGSKKVSDIRSESNGKGFDIIFIDYLQLLRSDGKRGANRYAEVGDISRGIKAIAMDYNIPVVILSQLNRYSEKTTDKEPSAADFRESGDIEQDVSVALLLWSPDKNDDSKRMLKIELNRQGQRKRDELYFDGKHMKFYETGQAQAQEKKQESSIMDADIPFE